MTREINGVAYCSDYEELVGPIPDGKAEAKVIKAEHQTKPSSKTSAQTK